MASVFRSLEYASWAISVVLGLLLLYDLYRTNTSYSEDVLMSSREGEIEDEMMIEEPAALGGTP